MCVCVCVCVWVCCQTFYFVLFSLFSKPRAGLATVQSSFFGLATNTLNARNNVLISLATDSGYVFFCIILYIKNPLSRSLKKYCQVAETMFFPDWLIVSFFLNPKCNYSPALQEDARQRRPMDDNGSADICGTTVRNKRVFFWMRWLHRS